MILLILQMWEVKIQAIASMIDSVMFKASPPHYLSYYRKIRLDKEVAPPCIHAKNHTIISTRLARH
jgi:hypothetical protein